MLDINASAPLHGVQIMSGPGFVCKWLQCLYSLPLSDANLPPTLFNTTAFTTSTHLPSSPISHDQLPWNASDPD